MSTAETKTAAQEAKDNGATARQPARSRGKANDPPVKLEPTPELVQEAIDAEEQLAAEAAEIRADKEALTPGLFLKLLPLLRQPIPPGFILEVTLGKGKPYDSTGVRSVQVLIDRMNNVLTPLWWWDEVVYTQDGKLAEVTVHVGGDRGQRPLLSRSSMGGVDRGSTIGNVYKGSYTNAAKLAFARIGPGHEVYLGAADLDPDTNPQVAEAQANGGEASQAADEKIPAERAEKLAAIVAASGMDQKHLDAKLRSFGVASIEDLTLEQAMGLWEWVQQAISGEPEQPQLDDGGES